MDLKKVNSLINSLNLMNVSIKPYYKGINSAFFKEFVYIEAVDLLSKRLEKREIFAHKTLNLFDFGRLTILPDGKVYSNVNFPAIGTINDNIKELLYKELFHGKSWRRIRNKKPCSNCVYQWLCPSPSNYELVIGKPNLCHIIE